MMSVSPQAFIWECRVRETMFQLIQLNSMCHRIRNAPRGRFGSVSSWRPEPGHHCAPKEILAGSTVERKRSPEALPEAIKTLKFLISSIECCIDMTPETRAWNGWVSAGEQGWCSGESARLPPMCPGFDSRIWGPLLWLCGPEKFLGLSRNGPLESYVGWVYWFSTLLREVFLWVLRFFPLLKNQHLIWLDLVIWFIYLNWFIWFSLPNRPRSIYHYSSTAPRLSGQNCKFLKFLLSFNSQMRLGNKENNTKYRGLTWKPRSHARILIYRTWPISRALVLS